MKVDVIEQESSVQLLELPGDPDAAQWKQHPYTQKVGRYLEEEHARMLSAVLNAAAGSSDPNVRQAFAQWWTLQQVRSAIAEKPGEDDDD